jgi:hypothetical protein
MPDPASSNLATQVTGHQRFLFGSIARNRVDRELIAAIDKLGDGMENLHFVSGHPSESALQRGCFQYLRAEAQHSRERDLSHPSLLQSQFLVRLEAAAEQSFLHFETQLRMLIEHRQGSITALAGVQRPRSYTSQAMTQFAYAGALQPGPGKQFPLGVVTPLNKTKEWWSMDWMRRESFFLPRYDPKGAVMARGHALAAEPGIPHIVRRLVHAAGSYGRKDVYDFIGYFEFAEEQAPVFRAVMAALRNVEQNPEWAYVREGPEWWGRRVGRVAELWG